MKNNVLKIIKRLKEFFCNIFKFSQTKKLPASCEIDNVENKKQEKERLFSIYNQIKNDNIELDSLTYKDLTKIRELLNIELEYHKEKRKKEQEENIQLRVEIQNLIKKIQTHK